MGAIYLRPAPAKKEFYGPAPAISLQLVENFRFRLQLYSPEFIQSEFVNGH